MTRARKRIVVLAVAGALAVPVLLLAAAPLVGAAGWPQAEAACRDGFARVCHRLSGRSFQWQGSPLGACARCTGVYLGLLAGALLQPLHARFLAKRFPLRPGLLLAFALPALVEAAAARAGLIPDLAILRAGTALIAAVPPAALLVEAALEIFSDRGSTMEGVPHAEA